MGFLRFEEFYAKSNRKLRIKRKKKVVEVKKKEVKQVGNGPDSEVIIVSEK